MFSIFRTAWMLTISRSRGCSSHTQGLGPAVLYRVVHQVVHYLDFTMCISYLLLTCVTGSTLLISKKMKAVRNHVRRNSSLIPETTNPEVHTTAFFFSGSHYIAHHYRAKHNVLPRQVTVSTVKLSAVPFLTALAPLSLERLFSFLVTLYSVLLHTSQP